ncbi:hypothetical protein ACWD0G_28560, partial [Streptomyces goshikiensis]
MPGSNPADALPGADPESAHQAQPESGLEPEQPQDVEPERRLPAASGPRRPERSASDACSAHPTASELEQEQEEQVQV